MAKADFSKKAKILNNNFLKLKKANRSFSLRALAGKVGVSHVFLGKVFNGKSRASTELLEKLIDILKIDSLEASFLRDEASTVVEKFKGSDTSEYEVSPESYLMILRKWWNFAILDLLTCDLAPRYDEEVLLKFLPIQRSELMASLKQLKDLGLIKDGPKGLEKVNQKIRLPARGPNESTRAYYRQTLKMAMEQLDRISQEEYESRSILGFSCAVNKKNVPLAKQKLAASLRECAELLSEGDCDDVYVIQGQMFSVLKK